MEARTTWIRRKLFPVVLAAALIATGAASGAPGAESTGRDVLLYYVGDTLGAAEAACDEMTQGGVGGACFDVRGGEIQLQVKLTDVTARPVAARVHFFGPDMTTVGVHRVCMAADLAIPPGAAGGVVEIASFRDGCEFVPAATVGVVSLRFRQE